MKKFDIADHKIIFDVLKNMESSPWLEHMPFAFFLISIVKPRVFVELGVHTGNSFKAFCHAVKRLELGVKCYGVDTWKGDEHAGYYDDSIYSRLVGQIEKEYPFASLMRMTFNEAVNEFTEESIDIMHIDGYHSYEAVKSDFEKWLPKMKKGSVVILHDTEVRNQNFGVWKFWEEISQKYASLNFTHSFGLGIVFVGNDDNAPVLEFIRKAKGQDFYRDLFARLGNYFSLLDMVRTRDIQIAENDKVIKAMDSRISSLERQLEGIFSSKSWKMTAPLRKLYSTLRKR